MNITPHISQQPLATVVNQPTDSLRRENNMREVITKPTAPSHSAAEKGVASDKDRIRTPSQQNEHIDFISIQKKAEEENTTIGDAQQHQGEQPQQDAQSSEEQSQKESPEKINGLTPEQFEEVQDLKQRDKEVRAHETTHAAVGGAYTGSPNYTFQSGPDGKKYAVEGNVSVDLSKVSGDPSATITKMKKVYAAALAPANPSNQDKQVAATAAKIIVEAQSELLAEKTSTTDNDSRSANTGTKSDVDNVVQGAKKEFNNDEFAVKQANEFDTFINATLKAQDEMAPVRDSDVSQRANRIERFYSTITKAYETAPRYQFKISA